VVGIRIAMPFLAAFGFCGLVLRWSFGLQLCRAVLRVDTVPPQQITKSLEFVGQGG
jgi:hypothetical protein